MIRQFEDELLKGVREYEDILDKKAKEIRRIEEMRRAIEQKYDEKLEQKEEKIKQKARNEYDDEYLEDILTIIKEGKNDEEIEKFERMKEQIKNGTIPITDMSDLATYVKRNRGKLSYEKSLTERVFGMLGGRFDE